MLPSILINPVNGVLVGKEEAGTVTIVDIIPLLHHWTSLSPMMEIGLGFGPAESMHMKLVGYYQASERIDDTALAPVGGKIASKVKEGFGAAVAFVIDGNKLGTGDAALVPYVSQGSSWRCNTTTPADFAPGSVFQLASADLPARAVKLVQEKRLHQKFGDFDDHLEDVTIDWLKNKDCLPPDVL
ncbi:uncharacterized protein EV420DRAFT_1705731 [Desarmillaria tabescens]|uniref:Uncharacterized protein n=1 Tax=Armillaria tabescens TaxID=1929756 RepID=A0AA39JZE7_ARMTA|nr:uncharacterized protein EV420DRAFT_1705731 [Desarmillaria tabescens]KAK0450294.1 hypothetical protein EV420DRAFT_1705731 [Desarmillaria tabescens]